MKWQNIDDGPKECGWYVISYCWDIQEGIFYEVDYFRISSGWDIFDDFPIVHFIGPFDDESEADEELERIWSSGP